MKAKNTLFSLVSVLFSVTVLANMVAFAEDVSAEDVNEPPAVVSSDPTCSYDTSVDPFYKADLINVRRKFRVEEGEIFRVKVFMKNAGNTPWFSEKSDCSGPKMYLGTDNPRDRNSDFYSASLDGVENTNWVSPNRVGMDQKRIDPGEIASFTYWSKAPAKADVRKEYMTPVLEGVKWLDDDGFDYDLLIGYPEEPPSDTRARLFYANKSGSAMNIPLEGEKFLKVDVSDQLVHVMLGDYEVRTFPVSTGKPSTPTPYGEFSIKLKQDVRVGSAPPHYIMPKFMWFRSGGYGFHALPSLGNDNGVFWTEALTHIQIPVSHGCIRLLTDDANWLFDFTPVGARVIVQP